MARAFVTFVRLYVIVARAPLARLFFNPATRLACSSYYIFFFFMIISLSARAEDAGSSRRGKKREKKKKKGLNNYVNESCEPHVKRRRYNIPGMPRDIFQWAIFFFFFHVTHRIGVYISHTLFRRSNTKHTYTQTIYKLLQVYIIIHLLVLLLLCA